MTAAAGCALNAKRAVLGAEGAEGAWARRCSGIGRALGGSPLAWGTGAVGGSEWAQAAAESGVEHRSQRLADAAMHEGAGGGPAAALAARHGWEPHRKLAAATEPTKQPHAV